MGCFHIFITVSMMVAVFTPAILAEEFIVGDETGWTVGFDYQAWAVGKNFQIGDKLVFKYPVGAHNVFKVNGTGFQNCIVPPPNEALTTGNDTILLATRGKKWYICGVGRHCTAGQKLTIIVQPLSPAPAPSPAPSPDQSLTNNGLVVPPSVAPSQHQYMNSYSSAGSRNLGFFYLYIGLMMTILAKIIV